MSEDKINIIIEKTPDGFIIYDDTQSFIDFVHSDDKHLVVKIVSSIVKDRVDGNKSFSLW